MSFEEISVEDMFYKREENPDVAATIQIIKQHRKMEKYAESQGISNKELALLLNKFLSEENETKQPMKLTEIKEYYDDEETQLEYHGFEDENCNLQGQCIRYYDNGVIKTIYNYKNDKLLEKKYYNFVGRLLYKTVYYEKLEGEKF